MNSCLQLAAHEDRTWARVLTATLEVSIYTSMEGPSAKGPWWTNAADDATSDATTEMNLGSGHSLLSCRRDWQMRCLGQPWEQRGLQGRESCCKRGHARIWTYPIGGRRG